MWPTWNGNEQNYHLRESFREFTVHWIFYIRVYVAEVSYFFYAIDVLFYFLSKNFL